MIQTIPELKWKRANTAALDRFIATINKDEYFVVSYDPGEVEGYQWKLFLRHRTHGILFLHGHLDKETAIQAAHRHIGDE